jgi:hypothetical protein
VGDEVGEVVEKKTEVRRGRKAFVATDDQRGQVRTLTADRVQHKRIAALLGISVPTLRKVFGAELADRSGGVDLFVGGDADPLPVQLRPAPARKPAKGGRKPFAPDRETREKVSLLVAVGTAPDDIAKVVGITTPTLRKHFAEELATAATRKRAEVLMDMMRAAKKGNVTAQRELLELIDNAALSDLETKFRMTNLESPLPKQKEEPTGKKIQQALDAQTAPEGTEWANLLQ